MAFSKLKALLRQEPARTIDALVNRIGNLLDRFLPTECANFFMQQDINAQSENALGSVDEFEPVSGSCDMHHAHEAVGELVLAGRDGAVDLSGGVSK